MNLEKEKLLKPLHICLNLPIYVFDHEFNLVKEYYSDRTVIFFYDYQQILLDNKNNEKIFSLFIGSYDEIFLFYKFNRRYYLFGPFRCNMIDGDFLKVKMINQNIELKDQEVLYDYLNALPLFALGDIRDIVTLIHYFFTGKIEDLFHNPLHQYVKQLNMDIKNKKTNEILSQNYDPDIYLYIYENNILDYVKNGDIESLKEMVYRLSNAVVPSINGDMIRSEKNYSITVFEKLAQVAIFLGMDIIDAYQSRDAFIRKNELASSLQELLQIRDSAIVFYTKEIGIKKSKRVSALISSIIQYIGLNLYRKITVKEIAEYFSISETKLQLSFKKEMGETLYHYITRRKVSEAKVMLKSNYTITEIALALGYSDVSHLSKVFKKHTGISPKQYQLKSLQRIPLYN